MLELCQIFIHYARITGMPTSGNQKAGDFSILAGVPTKKREVEDEKAGDSKYMLF